MDYGSIIEEFGFDDEEDEEEYIEYSKLASNPRSQAIQKDFSINHKVNELTVAEKMHFDEVFAEIKFVIFFGCEPTNNRSWYSFLQHNIRANALHMLRQHKKIKIEGFDGTAAQSPLKISQKKEVSVPASGAFVITVDDGMEVVIRLTRGHNNVEWAVFCKNSIEFGKWDKMFREATKEYNQYKDSVFDQAGKFIDLPQVTFDDIFIDDEIRSTVKTNIIDYIDEKQVKLKEINNIPTKRGVIFEGDPGTGKCLATGTRILNPKTGEVLTVDELYEQEHSIVYSLNTDLKFTQRSAIVVNNGVKPCYELATKYGRKITLTENHPLLTLDGWKPLKDLKAGDKIAVPKVLNVFGDIKNFPDYKVRLLGAFIADGRTTTLALFSNITPCVVQQFKKDIKAFNPQLAIKTYGDKDHVVYYKKGRSSPIRGLLRDHGIFGKHSWEKSVPDIIFKLPKRQIALFINSLYACDGSIYYVKNSKYPRGHIEYDSTSEQLIYGLQHLLLRFGISGNISSKRMHYTVNGKRKVCRKNYRLIINDGECVNIFLTEIGALGKTENIVTQTYTECNQQFTIPHEIVPYIEKILKEKDISKKNLRCSKALTRPKRSLSRKSVGRIGEVLDDLKLQALAISDVLWHPIESIEHVGELQTYDLSVPAVHNLVANDIVVHNTFLARVLANTLTASFMVITNLSSLEELRNIFKFASQFERVILLFEDIDIYINHRSLGSGLLPTMLNALDGIETISNHMVVLCTTNCVESFDDALKNRPGRFDVILHFGAPKKQLKVTMLKGFCKGKNSDAVDFDQVIKDVPAKYTGAHLKELYISACAMAIENGSVDGFGGVILTTDIFIRALNRAERGAPHKKAIGFRVDDDNKK